MQLLITWLIDPRHNALLTWIGFGVGLLGTILGLYGLLIALRQLKAIKTETEASVKAIKEVQIKIASFDTIQECQAAGRIISDIRTSNRQSEWSKALTAYESLIQVFLKIGHSNSLVEEGDRDLMRKHTVVMAKMCEAIRRKLVEANSPIVLKGQDRALRDFLNITTKVAFAITKEMQK